MVNNQRGSALVQTIWALAGLVVIAAATLHIVWEVRASTTNFTTPFQAVLLTNGSVYFGHLQGYGGHNPVLTDVFYIVTQTNPETKQSNNVLVKRGKELHEPAYVPQSEFAFVRRTGRLELKSSSAHRTSTALVSVARLRALQGRAAA
jgi:hypothetical protein